MQYSSLSQECPRTQVPPSEASSIEDNYVKDNSAWEASRKQADSKHEFNVRTSSDVGNDAKVHRWLSSAVKNWSDGLMGAGMHTSSAHQNSNISSKDQQVPMYVPRSVAQDTRHHVSPISLQTHHVSQSQSSSCTSFQLINPSEARSASSHTSTTATSPTIQSIIIAKRVHNDQSPHSTAQSCISLSTEQRSECENAEEMEDEDCVTVNDIFGTSLFGYGDADEWFIAPIVWNYMLLGFSGMLLVALGVMASRQPQQAKKRVSIKINCNTLGLIGTGFAAVYSSV